MVATHPAPRWPSIQFDRATAFGLALAGNALFLMLLSLPRDEGDLRYTLPPEPEPIRIEEIITRAEPTPLPPVPDMPRPPEPQPRPVLQPIVEQPTSNLQVAAVIPPSIESDAAPSVPVATTAPGETLQRRAGVSYGETPAPRYPGISIRRGQQGTVMLRVLVGTDGRPRSVEIDASSGHRELDQAAQQQVMQRWRFIPALRDGREVEAWVRVPVEFNLQRR